MTNDYSSCHAFYLLIYVPILNKIVNALKCMGHNIKPHIYLLFILFTTDGQHYIVHQDGNAAVYTIFMLYNIG